MSAGAVMALGVGVSPCRRRRSAWRSRMPSPVPPPQPAEPLPATTPSLTALFVVHVGATVTREALGACDGAADGVELGACDGAADCELLGACEGELPRNEARCVRRRIGASAADADGGGGA
jgi:hypothetical protein